jgi:WD40 repeat protein
VPTLRLVAVYAGHEDDVEMVDFRPDGERLATVSRDQRVRVFDRSGELLHELPGHTADAISVQWIDGGAGLVSSSDDGTIRFWDAERGALLHTVDLGQCETDTVCVGDDGLLYAGNDAGDIIVIRGTAPVRTVRGHQAGIKRLAFDRTTRTLLSMSYDRRVRFWSALDDDLALEHETVASAAIWVRSASLAARGRVAFATFGSSYATYDRERRAWDLSGVEDTGGLNAVAAIDGDVWTVGDAGVVRINGRPARRLASLCNFIVDWNGLVVTGGQSGELFDARTGRTLHTHRSPLNCGAVVPHSDGSAPRLIVGTYTGEGLLFERCDGVPRLVRELALHANAIKGVACDGREMLSVCADRAVAFHDLDGEPKRALAGAHDKIANGVAVVRPGLLASVSRDLSLRLWSSEGVRHLRSPHKHSIKCVAACPISSVVATGGYDGTIILYDVDEARWLAPSRPTSSGISSLTWSGTQGVFLASSYDGCVYVASSRGHVAELIAAVYSDPAAREPLTKLAASW